MVMKPDKCIFSQMIKSTSLGDKSGWQYVSLILYNTIWYMMKIVLTSLAFHQKSYKLCLTMGLTQHKSKWKDNLHDDWSLIPQRESSKKKKKGKSKKHSQSRGPQQM